MDWTTWLQFTLSVLGGIATILFGYATIHLMELNYR